ncbi:KICSTOR complex protein ITFG2-like isoform X3 [Dreissena polymorpha]|uniref:KICSTOR complex protein ITFG2-like isoform X3 n=1 Tax=Dreissena polymorpha TaxID=45954 RepID=UPI002264C5D3|nr:KICSTOR complex protein ITFG2-like isoform X3 [Dreissena polymorpha]
MWRTVSFVERVEVEFSGNLFNQAIILGDFDNDKGNELAVGNIDGTLAIFKGRGHKPWRKCSDLGMITCITVGDIYSTGKNQLLCLTAEGWLYVFDVKVDYQNEPGHESHDDDEKGDNLMPTFKQHLPPNGKVMQAADIDSDGKVELAIGYSDRVIRLYKWQCGLSEMDGETGGFMIQINKWQLAGQIGSITVSRNKAGLNELMASQPGGTYVKLVMDPSDQQEHDGLSESVPANLIYDPLMLSEIRNSNISTEIIGNIRKCPGSASEKETDVLFALCTLDGTLVLVDSEGIIQWSLQVDHQLFSLNKLDVTGNGKEEVVCCSWDGQTYIVNHSREAVRYQFEENVAAFTAGYFAVNTTDNVPCFVYATFNNRIYIYYNIQLPQVESTNLIEVMDKREETRRLLDRLKLGSPRNRDLQELYRWCLYGWKDKS